MEEKIWVVSPTGKEGKINRGDLAKYKSMNYTEGNNQPIFSDTEILISPSGLRKPISKDQVKLYKEAGYSTLEPQSNFTSNMAKGALKGILSPLELPHAVASGIEGLANFVTGEEDQDYSGYVPSPTMLREKLKEHTDIDLEPHYTTDAEKIIGNALEFGLGFPAGGTLGNLATKGSTAQKLLGTTKNFKEAGKQFGIGAGIGGTSGALQTGGVDPLAADLIATGAAITGHAGAKKGLEAVKGTMDYLSAPNRQIRGEKKVAGLLRDRLDPATIEAIEKYNGNHQFNNLKVEPTTAEIFNDRGLHDLYNSYKKDIPGIAEKQLANDAVIRNNLTGDLGNNLNPTANDVGNLSREAIGKVYKSTKKNRRRKSKPAYRELRKDKELYSTENFNNYTQQAIKDEVGTTEKGLVEVANILPKKYKPRIEHLQRKIDDLRAKTDTFSSHYDDALPIVDNGKIDLLNRFKESHTKGHEQFKDYHPEARQSALDQDPLTAQIRELEEEIAAGGNSAEQLQHNQNVTAEINKATREINRLEDQLKNMKGKATPAHIDKTITALNTKIKNLKNDLESSDDTLLGHLKQQKIRLIKDFELTPSGKKAREIYAENSAPVNAIKHDPLLKQFINKNKFDNYKKSPENIINDITSSSVTPENVEAYMRYTQGSKANPATKAYFRNEFLGKAPENGLPIYNKANEFLSDYGDKLQKIYKPEEYNRLQDINRYLKNRNNIDKLSVPKETIKEVEKTLGSDYQKSLPDYMTQSVNWLLNKKLPIFRGDINKMMPTNLFQNPAYPTFHETMVNPKAARDVLGVEAREAAKPKKKIFTPLNNYNPIIAAMTEKQMEPKKKRKIPQINNRDYTVKYVEVD